MPIPGIVSSPKRRKLSSTPLTFAWTDSAIQTAASTTSSFSSRAIGTADTDRLVIVMVSARTASTDGQITGLTIGGVSAARLVQSDPCRVPTAIFALVVPTGTTATIVVTADQTLSGCAIGVCNAKGYRSATPTTFDTSYSGATNGRNLDIAITGGGVGLWVVAQQQSGAASSWSSADEQYDFTTGGGSSFGATGAKYEAAATANRNGSASWTGGTQTSICAVALR